MDRECRQVHEARFNNGDEQMKAAVLVGVSNYERASNLPACDNDVELMQLITKTAGPFDEVLVLTGPQTKSSAFKASISSFFAKCKNGEEIDELVFYFSGHGLTQGDQFYYALSDYDPKRVSTTCYSNTELDETIRALAPKLTVKMVDACQSGQQYIKEAIDFNIVFDTQVKKSINQLYFLFSSASTQASFCDDSYSYFTKSIAQGIAQHGTPDVRYRDLVDFTTDAFADNLNQKPFFVTQGSNTEVFGTFSPEVKTQISGLLTKPSLPAPTKDIQLDSSLVGILQTQAKSYLDIEQVREVIQLLETKASKFAFAADVNILFKISVEPKDAIDTKLPLQKISEFIASRNEDVLAKVIYTTRKIRVPKSPFSGGAFLSLGTKAGLLKEDDRYEEREMSIPSRFEHSIDQLPFQQLDIVLRSNLPNLSDYSLSLVYVVTPTTMHLFSIVGETKYARLVGTRESTFKLASQYTYNLRELLENAVTPEAALEDFEKDVHNRLRKIAGLADPEPVEA